MLGWRLGLGTLLIAAVAGLVALDARAATPGIWFLPLALLVAAAGSQELLGLAAARGLQPHAGVVYAGNVLIVASNWLPILGIAPAPMSAMVWPAAALALSAVGLFVAEMARFREPGGIIERLGVGMLALVYVGLLTSFLCQLRLLGPMLGLVALCSLILVVKLGDIGAYTVGRLVGRHKLIPRLSPGKTWEGLFGGLAASCLGAWLAFGVLLPLWVPSAPPVAAWQWLLFGVVVGVAGVLGDLAESLLKRDAGRKDSSTWMPGFGGVLDIMDSLLLSAPVAYLAWTYVLGVR